MADLDEPRIVELGKLPISDEAPCGRDAAEDDQYLLLDAELGKLDRVDLAQPDWPQIEQAATSILRTKSKDLDVACALALALFRKHRYDGLAAGLALIQELVTNFWENLFPLRPRRRKTRIESLAERLADADWLRRAPPSTVEDFDAVDHCVERLSALQAALAQKAADDPPNLASLTRRLRDLAATRPKGDQPSTPAADATAPGGKGITGGTVLDAAGLKDVPAALKAILTAATFVRQADPTDPVPYAIARIIRWSRVELPPTDAARRQLEPPDKSLPEALSHQSNKGLWEHVLKSAEAAFRASDPLWLDLQWYVCTALQGLGAAFERARAMVMDLTAGLVRRLGAGVYELTFRDGTPLCSGKTRLWLESEVMGAPATAAGASAAASRNGKLVQASAEARRLAGTGRLSDAVKTLQEGLAACTQGRDRLLWRLRMAQLCCDAGRLRLGAPLLDECFAEIRRFHIEEWEPSLAVEVVQTRYRCCKALAAAEKPPTPQTLESARESFAWLCQLDPLAALAVEPAAT